MLTVNNYLQMYNLEARDEEKTQLATKSFIFATARKPRMLFFYMGNSLHLLLFVLDSWYCQIKSRREFMFFCTSC